MTARIRLCIIGLGRMGSRWLRVARESPRFEVVATVDPVALDATHRDLDDAPAFDAAIIASPTTKHFSTIREAFQTGGRVLVEKPVATNVSDAVWLAHNFPRSLVVGHIERFNPGLAAVRQAMRILHGGALHISFVRIGGRPADAIAAGNVVLDLAIHDLDLARHLLGPVRLADALVTSDAATIRLEARDWPRIGVTVSVSWRSPEPDRRIVVSSADSSIATGMITKRDVLADQLAAFARAIDGEDAGPLCSAEDGAAAVELAERAMRGECGGNFV